MKKLVIFGTGDFAQVAWSCLRADSPYEIAAFSVHDQYIQDPVLLGTPVVPFERLVETHPPDDYAMFVAIGYKRLNQTREEVYKACKAKAYELITYVNSRACCSEDVEMGDNCFIFEQNVIQPFVKIGNDVIAWSGSHFGHHSQIDDHCFISSHAVISGRVHIGANCFVGVNATFRDGVIVGPRCVIGGGAVIMRDTASDEVYGPISTEASRISSSRLRAFR